MGAGTKGIAESIVKACEKNPRLAFFLIPFGVLIAYWGISDAKYYQSLSDRPTQVMTVVAVESKPNHRGFSAPHVTGTTAEGEVSVPVSAKTARQVQIGEELGFVETNDSTRPYVLRSILDSQLSQIYFKIAGLPFNFVALLGAAIAIFACAWGAFAKPKGVTPDATGKPE
jgi:hypothetical protein